MHFSKTWIAVVYRSGKTKENNSFFARNRYRVVAVKDEYL